MYCTGYAGTNILIIITHIHTTTLLTLTENPLLFNYETLNFTVTYIIKYNTHNCVHKCVHFTSVTTSIKIHS